MSHGHDTHQKIKRWNTYVTLQIRIVLDMVYLVFENELQYFIMS